MSDNPANRGRGRGRGRGDRGDGGGRGGRGGGDRGRGGGPPSDSYRGGRGGGPPSDSYRGGRGGGPPSDSFRGGRGGGPPSDSFRGGRGGGDRGRGSDRGSDRGGGRGRGRGGGGEFVVSMRGGRGGFRGRGGGGFTPREPPKPFRYEGEAPPHPDQAIVKLEDQLMAPAAAKGGKKSAKPGPSGAGPNAGAFRFPFRPAYGREGRAIEVWANYFELDINKMPTLFLYTFHVSKGRRPSDKEGDASASTSAPAEKQGPGADIRGPFLRRLIRHVLDNVLNVPGLSPRTELLSKIITLEKIPQAKIDELKDTEFDGDHFKIELDGPLTLDLDALRKWLKTMRDDRDVNDVSFPKFQDLIDAIGIIIGHGPRMGGGTIQNPRTVAVGRGYFFPVDETREGELFQRSRPLELLRGYFQSVRPATGRLLLNVNVTHTVFRSSRERHFADLFRDCHYKDLELALKGGRVRVEIPGGKSREYTVSGFVFKSGTGNTGEARFKKISEVTFMIDADGTGDKGGKNKKKAAGGKSTTVRDYLKEKFNVPNLEDTIAVNVGKSASKAIIYPASWCTLLPGQPWNRKLSGEDTSFMIKFACRQPNLNADSIVKVGRKALQLDSRAASFKDYSISVGDKLITVSARVLAAPDLQYGKKYKMTPAHGSWNLVSRELVQGGSRNTSNVKWAFFEMPGARGDVPAAMASFKTALGQLGVPVNEAPIGLSKSDDFRQFDTRSPNGIERAVEAAFQRAMEVSPRPRVILFVLADNDKTVYERIKLLGDTKYGIHTVCVVSQKFTKNDKQYYANVALKFNLKLGGINHKLDRPEKLGIISEGKTMVMGYDIIHPTNLGIRKEDDDLPSHVGLVASIDKDLAQWPACQWSQKGRQEMASDELTEAIRSRLDRWKEHNGAYPENIIVYRDGVSEGQFEQVLDTELPQMKEALKRCGMVRTKITIVVSVKRHNTRFFPTTAENMSRSGNIECGTVVDRGITLQRYWDFFLTAHTAIQGTARPARYTVIYDEIFQGKIGSGGEPVSVAGELEKITYNMCYLFSRATKAVSICPPAYYADLVCTRARLYQSNFFNSAIEGTQVKPQDKVLPQVHENVRRDMYYI